MSRTGYRAMSCSDSRWTESRTPLGKPFRGHRKEETMGIRWKLLFAFATVIVVCLSAAGPAAAPKFSDWSPPVLVPNVNSEFLDNGPAISWDQRSLYFSSDRPGFGGHDIWVSQRARVKDTWGKPVNLGPTINTT